MKSDPDITSKLDELERIERKATKGPWYVSPDDGYTIRRDYGNCRSVAAVSQVTNEIGVRDNDCDAAFIAAFRNAAPDLIAAVRERDELERLAYARNPFDPTKRGPTFKELEQACREQAIDDLREAKARASDLRVLLDKAEEALKPLAAVRCRIDDVDAKKGYAFDRYPDEQHIFSVGTNRVITAGDVRRAASVLSEIRKAKEPTT